MTPGKWAKKSNLGYIRDCLPRFFFSRRNDVVTNHLESEVPRLLLETMILLVRCSGLEGASIKICAKLYQKFSMGS